jgi:hypothetical protein
MNSYLHSLRIPGVAFLLAVCLIGPTQASRADEHNDPVANTVSFSWQSVPGYIVGWGHNIVNRGKRALEPVPTYQYQEPRARYYDQHNRTNNSMESAVQQSLARSGYYTGPIDGCIGPMSRRAIANYQADRGMRVTGYPNESLLASLGLQ